MCWKTLKMFQNKVNIGPSHGSEEWNQIDCVETVGVRRIVSSLVTCLESRRQRGFGPREHIPLPSVTSKTVLTGTSDRKSSILGENKQTRCLPLSRPFSLSSFHSSYSGSFFSILSSVWFSPNETSKYSVLFCQT